MPPKNRSRSKRKTEKAPASLPGFPDQFNAALFDGNMAGPSNAVSITGGATNPEATNHSFLNSPISSPGSTDKRQIGESNWYTGETWTQEKVAEQEERAAKLLGDMAHIKATLIYYCANDVQHHDKWVRILAEHITLLAEAKGLELHAAVAYQVSQQQTSKYRQQLEASVLETEAKRSINEVEDSGKGSVRGKRKVARTDPASISKGTHPFNKKSPGKRRSPRRNYDADNESDGGNFKLIGPDDFLDSLKIPENGKRHMDSFRRLRDDIFDSLRNGVEARFFFIPKFSFPDFEPEEISPHHNFKGCIIEEVQQIQQPLVTEKPQDTKQTDHMEVPDQFEDRMQIEEIIQANMLQHDAPDAMDIDEMKIPGHLSGNDRCCLQ
ncbi:hypothetical protein TWF694_007614 [Orbilia ellipsospora]|uniref:Uncharacterized protein n=1 Tax=Orbilia ellipsospora TaxID=2528407 RepID=A0AAV9XI93_9PEZI